MSTLKELGEKEVVKRILGRLESSVAVGPGDDAAAIDMGDKYLVVTTDMITRKSHMPQGASDWQMGWMAAAVNYSDIAAMGAKPLGIVVSFGLPRDTDYSSMEEMMNGISECSSSVGAEILGGDTKESSELVISGAALGTVNKDEILLRKGAGIGDLIAVTGTIGLASAGYQALHHVLPMHRAVEALLTPKPRVSEGILLASSKAVTSCMDITDGLAYSIHQLSKCSGVHFEIDWSSIPVDGEVFEVSQETGISMMDMVLYYGGDYELLFTFKSSEIGRLTSLLGSKFTVIGRARNEPGGNVLIKCGQIVPLEDRGWEHFR